MISKSKAKFIRALDQKKHRREEKAFVAEGPKIVDELLGVFPCRMLVATPEWMSQHPHLSAIGEVIEVSDNELERISLLQCPQQVLAVFDQPTYNLQPEVATRSLCLGLDDIQDPGNLGTIIRLADWFGIEHVFCSTGTTDVFNPKCVQATMGAIARVKVHYTPLPDVISHMADSPVYGTFLDGGNLYEQTLDTKGLIIMGNEGRGISHAVEPCITRRLYIPNFPVGRDTSESLNVAVATAIVCAEFRRRQALASR